MAIGLPQCGVLVSGSNGLVGLSLLSGSSAFSALSAASGGVPKAETAAQRKARAAFTLPATIAPWKAASSKLPVAQRVAQITALRSVIDAPSSADAALPTDVRTTFTAYKALDKLQTLAEAAARDTTPSTDRAKLEKAFSKGLADLKTYLGGAVSDQLHLSYGSAAREVRTVGVASPSSLTAETIAGKGVRDTRDGALVGLAGNERFRITLSQANGSADSVTVDLSAAPQPPTLDGVADAINAVIKALPRLDASGNVTLDDSGVPVARWQVSLEPTKIGEKWGLSLKRAGFETVSIDQIDAPDTVLIAGGSTGSDSAKPVPTSTRLTRLDSPEAIPVRSTLGTISATDSLATARSALAADADTTGKVEATTIAASISSEGIATDAAGFSYIIGTTAGDTGSNLANGASDLLLTKVDSEGKVVWHRNLGAAGAARGASVATTPDGGIVVAGSVTGRFDGATSDGDIIVARYDAQGNEQFATLVRAIGQQSAGAIAVSADGTIYVGGYSDANGGGGTITRLDASGVVTQSRTITGTTSAGVRALAIGGDGQLVALTSEGGQATLRKIDVAALSTDLAALALGPADARAIGVAQDGSIAVGGATEATLPGAQANGRSNGTDGFVARIDGGLSAAAITYLGSNASDQVDSVSFLGDDLYVGGRTTGTLNGERTGDVDAFVARISGTTGSIERIDQFGIATTTAEAVRVSAIAGGNSVLGALGLHRGTLTPTDSVSLEAQTSIRTGDEFSIRVGSGPIRKVTIAENETVATLAEKVRRLGGPAINVTTPLKGTGRSLSIAATPGNQVELIAGTDGRDALVKLGIDAKRIAAPAPLNKSAPKVRPGGEFGLDLNDALQIDTKNGAAIALSRVKQAISFAQSAYRALYWDDTKAALADPQKPGKRGGSTVIEKAQLSNYQAALTRLSSTSSSFSTGF